MEDFHHPKYRKVENGMAASSTNNNSQDISGDGWHHKVPHNSTQNDDVEPSQRNSIAWKMMQDMGWREGRGIGAAGQGRAEPVTESSQVGRLGLGMRPESLDISEVGIKWSPGMDTAGPGANLRYSFTFESQLAMNAVKDITSNPPAPIFRSTQNLRESVDERFMDSYIIDCILKLKTRLDNYDDRMVRDARSRCNPYETLMNGQYMNRAALKMANINAVFDFTLTAEWRRPGNLYFADICAGPGGFTEYLLSQRPLTSVGYGFTLKGKDDFKRERILMGPSECFCCHYGARDDGNIYYEENMASLAQFVRSNSGQNEGLHLVTADGGFDVTSNENNQEIVSKRLYLCQCLCALRLLRQGGDFVCKLFDMVTPFSLELIFLMSACFETIYIVKPVTSRPANSERYLVGIDRRHGSFVDPVINFLKAVNDRLEATPDWESLDLVSMMADDILNDYPEFVNLMQTANNELGHQQAVALSKLHHYLDDRNMIDDRQPDIRIQCLVAWRLSDSPRPSNLKADVPNEVAQLLTGASPKDLLKQWRPLRQENFTNFPKYSYKAMVLASDKPPVILYSRGHNQVYYFNAGKETWRRTEVDTEVEKVRLSLPRQTIVLGQVVREINPKGTKRMLYLHVLDALVIYGEDVRERHLIERHERLARMISVCKEAMPVPLSVPHFFRPYEPRSITRHLRTERVKGHAIEQEVFELPNGNLIIPQGLRLMKITKDPWILHKTRSNLKIYYFNTSTNTSQFEPPADALCSYSNGVDYFVTWNVSHNDTEHLVPWSQFFEEMDRPPPGEGR